MGGPGSGSWYRYNSKDTVEEYRELPICHFVPALKRVASGEYERDIVPISWSRNGEKVASILVFVEKLRERWPAVRLVYATSRYGGERQEHDYHVLVNSTPSNLPGNPGRRWWFICPLVVNGRACRRRVAKLYGGALFGCRHCHDLVYQSTRESHQAERLSRFLAGQIADELGGTFTPEEVAETLRDFDRDTLQLMGMASRLTRHSKKTERTLRKMGLT